MEETAEVRVSPVMTTENALRCFLLAAMVAATGFLAWQPSKLNLSMIMTIANPDKGTNLAWRPAETEAPVPEAPRRQPPPPEWRPSSSIAIAWQGNRALAASSTPRNGRIAGSGWQRTGDAHPWLWADDAPHTRRRGADDDAQPAQKSVSPYRVGDIAAWPDPEPAQAARPTPQPAAAAQTRPELAALTPLTMAAPAQPAPTATQAVVPVSTASAPQLQTEAPQPAANQPDWKTSEITGPIPGAYLTIYPKLKFVGLCVPGQGYIRKYNQVGVPSDLTAPKMEAHDGRTPYGRYYIADRYRDSDGPQLFLSWPSPDDARRIGLEQNRQMQVENAWRRQDLPPQDTAAGGGVGLNGLRNWVEITEGSFALEAPHMEEIYTALPDKAWVFIQQ